MGEEIKGKKCEFKFTSKLALKIEGEIKSSQVKSIGNCEKYQVDEEWSKIVYNDGNLPSQPIASCDCLRTSIEASYVPLLDSRQQ